LLKVAGGNKQQGYITKEDASSPTVSSEAFLLTCVIDATKKRDVAVVDIPNAFIQAVVEDKKTEHSFASMVCWLIYWGLLLLMSMDLMQRLGRKVKSNCLSNA
jgi:hypothetical protein